MNDQAILWLYPLILVAVISLGVYVRLGFAWTGGFCLQAVAILLVAAFGLLTPHHVLCATVGWGLFVLFVLVPKMIMSRLEGNLNLLNLDAAIVEAKKLRWFFWGPPGRYWLDVVEAMRCFLQGKDRDAEALIQKWKTKELPRQVQDGLIGYLMTGRLLRRDWQGIIDELAEVYSTAGRKMSASTAAACARAYLELGDIPEALRCLETVNLPSIKMSDASREFYFLPLFSLAGAEPELQSVLNALSGKKQLMPECAGLYWRARCRAAAGRIDQSRQLLSEALDAVSPQSAGWRDRILFQWDRFAGSPDIVQAPDWSNEIHRARSLLESGRLVGDIVHPKRPCPATQTLISLIVGMYLLSHCFEFVRWAPADLLSNLCWQFGVLFSPGVLHGEYWRLITFLFLHAHVSHLILNLVGLWWFGRLSENLFGTRRFLLIYFASGILSGLSEVLWSQSLMSIGASGAVMGVFGASAAAVFRLKDLLPANLRKSELAWMSGLALAQVLLDQVVPNVAAFAHLGGLVAGFLIGLVLPLGRERLIARSKV